MTIKSLYRKPASKIVSGGAVGKRSKKIIGCEQCNHMELHSLPAGITAANTDPATAAILKKASPIKTGDTCPRCACPTLRVYDSQAEFSRAQELKILLSKGIITDLCFQVSYPLHAVSFATGKKEKVITYIADFTYNLVDKNPASKQPLLIDSLPTYTFVVEDVKPRGILTDIFVLKARHFKVEYGFPITIVEK
jgi:Protein of unknown function (DUF1064)